MTDHTADLYDVLTSIGIRSTSDEQRITLAEQLATTGFTPSHLDALWRSLRNVEGGDDGRASVLASLLGDPAAALQRAMKALGANQPNAVAARVNALTYDPVAKSRQLEAELHGRTPIEIAAIARDADVHTQVAILRRPILCPRGRLGCETRDAKIPCCVPEVLRRHGWGRQTPVDVMRMVEQHCERHPDEAWTPDRIRRYLDAKSINARIAVIRECRAQVRDRLAMEQAERVRARRAARVAETQPNGA